MSLIFQTCSTGAKGRMAPIFNKEGQVVINSLQKSKYIRYTDYLLTKAFMGYVNHKGETVIGLANSGWTVSDLADPARHDKLYQEVQRAFQSDYTKRKPKIPYGIQQELNQVWKYWGAFKTEHAKWSGLLSVAGEFESQDDEELPESTSQSVDIEDEEIKEHLENIDRPGNNFSTYELADNEIRTLFKMIPKVRYTESGEVQEVVNADALPVMTDSGAMFTLLANELSGINSEGEFERKLLSPKMRKKIPEISTINQLIGLNSPDKGIGRMNVYNKFYNLFTRPRIRIWMSQLKRSAESSKFSLFEAIKSNLDKIRDQFETNFLQGNMREDLLEKYTEIDTTVDAVTGRQVGLSRRKIKAKDMMQLSSADLTDVATRDLNVVLKDHLDFLEILGIKFTGLHLLDDTEKVEFADIVNRNAIGLNRSVLQRLEQEQDMYNPIEDLQSAYKSSPSDYNFINELVEQESIYSTVTPTLSYKNTKDEKQYVLSSHNHLTLSLGYLNGAQTIEELYTTPPFTNLKYNNLFTDSAFRNFLFDNKGKKIKNREITLNNYNGIEFVDTNPSGEKSKNKNNTNGLSERQKFIMDFNSFNRYNVIDIMRTEAKASFFSLFVVKNKNIVPLIDKSEFTDSFTKGKFGEQILKYFKSELARIASYPQKKSENPNVTIEYSEFSTLYFLSDELKDKIKRNDYTDDEVLSETETYFNGKLNELIKFRSDQGISISDLFPKESTPKEAYVNGTLPNSYIRQMYRRMIANTFVNNVEASILFTGDPLFNTKNFHKRLGGIVSTGTPVNNNSEYTTLQADNVQEQAFQNKYSLSSILQVAKRDNTNTYLSAVIADIVNVDNAYTREGDVLTGIMSSMEARGEKNISKDKVKEMIGDGEIKITDGQAYTHLDFHRELALKVGFWNADLEVAYMYEGLIFKEDHGGLTTQERDEMEDLRTKIYQNPNKYNIPTLKYTFYGPVQNATVDGKRFDKFSIRPILPSHARNHKELNRINLAMIKQQLGYVTHKSGTKQFFGNLTTDLVNAKPDILATVLLKEQLKSKTESKTDTTLLTQFISLLFTNLFNEGNAVNDNVAKIFDKYKDLFRGIHDTQKKAVQAIGIVLNENNEITGFNAKKLVDKINASAGVNFNSNVANALQVDSDGNLMFPIEQSGILSQVEDFVLGYLDKTLRRYKFQGGDFVVVSPAYTDNKLKYSKFNKDGTEKMEVRITFDNAHLPLLRMIDPGDPHKIKMIGTVQRLNKLLKNTDFVKANEKALTVVFGRSPVDSPHSLGVGIIKEFFEPTAGAIIELPEEFIYQSGIDFDIDKEKVYFPYLTDLKIEDIERKIKSLEEFHEELRLYNEEFDEENSSVENSENLIADVFKIKQKLTPAEELQELSDELHNTYKEYADLKRRVKEDQINQLLSLFEDILRLPESYADIAIPNSSKRIKDAAKDNADTLGQSTELPSRSEVFGYMNNLKVFNIFMKSKELLGVFAKSNTQNEFLKQAGVMINSEYDLDKYGNPTKFIKLLLHTSAEKDKVMDGKKIKIGRKYDVENGIRQYVRSQLINSTVDSANDPHFADLDITWANVNVAEFLDAIGIPFERIVDFLNLPIMKMYYKFNTQLGGKNPKGAAAKTLRALGIQNVREEEITTTQEVFMEELREGLTTSNPMQMPDGRYKYKHKKITDPNWKILEEIHRFNGTTQIPELMGIEFPQEINPERVSSLKTSNTFKLGEADFLDSLRLFSYFMDIELNQKWNFSNFKNLYSHITAKVGSTIDINHRKYKIMDSSHQ